MKFLKFFCVSAILYLVIFSSSFAEPMQGLVLYLPCDEGEGDTAKYLSGNGNDGALMGNPQWVAGKIGSALQFSGEENSNHVEVPDSPSLNPKTEISCAALIYSDEFKRTGGIISKYIGAGNQRGYDLHMFHDLDRSVNGACSSNGIYQVGVSTTAINTDAEVITDGEWAHVAMTFKAEDFLRIYVNGELKAEAEAGATESIFDNEVSLLIGTDFELGGNHNGQPREFTGIIDEVTIFNRALSDDEVKQVMNGLVMSVDPRSKLAATWGVIKVR